MYTLTYPLSLALREFDLPPPPSHTEAIINVTWSPGSLPVSHCYPIGIKRGVGMSETRRDPENEPTVTFLHNNCSNCSTDSTPVHIILTLYVYI